jgi:hypothetical protein
VLFLIIAHAGSASQSALPSINHIERRDGPLGDTGPESVWDRSWKLLQQDNLTWEAWFDAGSMILQVRMHLTEFFPRATFAFPVKVRMA